ncbi:hypothetical protein [Frigoribacterium sp. CG_9.8]|uniref:hypothetical protein n=1 Tax=Frigoribacterium sp. CG_9.8 TaxID=2787733 RepID=UPI0018CAAAB8|nr:hypothetical protein [Frigoribacterium sp. CG_9.8]MBG6108804.1 hypothetical protein [Frigoribacterium sp. CG_9.8]
MILSSGARAALIQTVPWMVGRHAAAVRSSIAAHDPGSAACAPLPPVNTPPLTTGPVVAAPVATVDPDVNPDQL